jgi:hypothetical protein
MPFRRYLAGDDRHREQPIVHGHDAVPSTSAPVQFQIPQFMYAGPPALAMGGGAEVLPNVIFDDPAALASSWFTNNAFPSTPTDDSYVSYLARLFYISLADQNGQT